VVGQKIGVIDHTLAGEDDSLSTRIGQSHQLDTNHIALARAIGRVEEISLQRLYLVGVDPRYY